MSFRVAFVPGVTPDKWARVWSRRLRDTALVLDQVAEEDQLRVLRTERADMCFVRLPVERDGLHVIPLYHELTVAVVGAEHPAAAYEELTVSELADEHVVDPALPLRQRIETVAAGTGIVVVPMSLARLHHRKDVAHVVLTDAEQSQIGLAWLTRNDDPLVERFIGIVRGRTEHSSRESPPTPKRRRR